MQRCITLCHWAVVSLLLVHNTVKTPISPDGGVPFGCCWLFVGVSAACTFSDSAAAGVVCTTVCSLQSSCCQDVTIKHYEAIARFLGGWCVGGVTGQTTETHAAHMRPNGNFMPERPSHTETILAPLAGHQPSPTPLSHLTIMKVSSLADTTLPV